MKTLLISLSLLLLISSCQEQSKETQFDKQGVSFTIPAGWKGVDEEDLGSGYSISIEKEGMDESGMVSISWIDLEIELDEWAQVFKDEMRSSWNSSVSNSSFSAVKNGRYNEIPTRSVTYKATLLGLKHTGTIHVFYEGGKSFGVIIQEAIEDKADNKEGFRLIEKSFKVE